MHKHKNYKFHVDNQFMKKFILFNSVKFTSDKLGKMNEMHELTTRQKSVERTFY